MWPSWLHSSDNYKESIGVEITTWRYKCYMLTENYINPSGLGKEIGAKQLTCRDTQIASFRNAMLALSSFKLLHFFHFPAQKLPDQPMYVQFKF